MMYRRPLQIITVFLLGVIGVSFVVGEYSRIHEQYGEVYNNPIRGLSTRLPMRPRDKWYPWLEPYFDESIWHASALTCSVSGGVYKPGERLDFPYGITATHYNRQNLTLHFKLIKLGKEPIVIEEKIEYKVGPPFSSAWIVKLPEEYPVEYRLGVVVYDEVGRIVDGLISPISIPKQELVAILRVEPEMVTVEEKASIVIDNMGWTRLLFGEMYDFEKLVNGTWKPAPSEFIWILPLHVVSPGGSYSQKMNIVGLDSGTYRVLKEVKADGTNLKQTLCAQFTINRPPEDPDEPPRWGYRVSWGLAEESIESPDRPMLELVNLGMRRLYMDGSYTLDVEESGTWKPLIVYEPTETHQQTVESGGFYILIIGEPGLKPARYRLSIEIGVEGTTARKTLHVDFHYKTD